MVEAVVSLLCTPFLLQSGRSQYPYIFVALLPASGGTPCSVRIL